MVEMQTVVADMGLKLMVFPFGKGWEEIGILNGKLSFAMFAN